ncbi:MAG: DUF99 family protein [Planctomycetes bacterium]|nr:DUF99 family protein [Planctomycetota bacterium]
MGLDDGPFAADWRGDVALVAITCVGDRLDGIARSTIRRDGRNSTDRIAGLVERAGTNPRVVLLQGIAVGGFNVVDIHRLHDLLGRPVLVVARKPPNMERIKRALLLNVPGGRQKWSLIERAGPMEPAHGVFVQRAGLTLREANQILEASTFHGSLPEPLRLAHLIAGAFVKGLSKGGA